MNQLELILENIRLSNLESLLMEAQTEQEVQSGMFLINETMNSLYYNFQAVLQENNMVNGALIGLAAAPVIGAAVGGGIGNFVHGNSGVDPVTGKVVNEQLHNDDEYDMTGAAIGGLLGATQIGRLAGAGLGGTIGSKIK